MWHASERKIKLSFVKGIWCVFKNHTLLNDNHIYAMILVYGLEEVVYIASFNHL